MNRCTVCKRYTSAAEVAAYGGRCEDCWAYQMPGVKSSGYSAAATYRDLPVSDDVREISNERRPLPHRERF